MDGLGWIIAWIDGFGWMDWNGWHWMKGFNGWDWINEFDWMRWDGCDWMDGWDLMNG